MPDTLKKHYWSGQKQRIKPDCVNSICIIALRKLPRGATVGPLFNPLGLLYNPQKFYKCPIPFS